MLINVDTNEFDIGAWEGLWINLDQHWLTSNWPMELTVLVTSNFSAPIIWGKYTNPAYQHSYFTKWLVCFFMQIGTRA